MQLDSSFSSTESKGKGQQLRQWVKSEEEKMLEDFAARSEAGSIENQINYPYSFSELASQLDAQVPFNQSGYFQDESASVLEEELCQMYELGYDMYFKNDCQHNEKSKYSRRFLRRIKMFYDCMNPNCSKFKGKQNKHNKWPTLYGLIFITYKFVDVQDKSVSASDSESEQYLKYPYVLRYDIRLYKQRCQSCGKMTEGQIYKSQMRTVSQMFCYMVAKILTFEKDPVVRPKKHRHADDNEKIPEEPKHQRENCQACYEEVCKSISKRKYRNG